MYDAGVPGEAEFLDNSSSDSSSMQIVISLFFRILRSSSSSASSTSEMKWINTFGQKKWDSSIWGLHLFLRSEKHVSDNIYTV